MKLRKSFISLKLKSIMLKIDAIVRSSSLHDIQNALVGIDIPTFTAYQVQITGIHRGHEGWRNKTSDFVPKTKIEILCKDEDEEKIIDTLQKTASTGEKGDGVVFTYQIGKIVKIKSGQTGTDAL